MRFKTFILLFFAGSVASEGGPLSTNQPYVEGGGRVGGEAENYHALNPGQGDNWTEVASNAPGAFANVRSSAYLQALPNDGPDPMTYEGGLAGPFAEYLVHIQTPGTYRLWLRWDGFDDVSDSIYAGIPELGDGPGGVPDWYEDTSHSDSDFATDAWDGLGGPEENVATSFQSNMTWNITNAGLYTLRMVAREDGVALDAWVLQLTSLPDPEDDGLTALNPDALTMHFLSKAGIRVLDNDTGLANPSTLAVVDSPSSGTADPTIDGRILYEHTTGSPANDSFTYAVEDISGTTATPATVMINFSTDLRIENTTVRMPVAPPPTTYQVVDAFPGIGFGTPTSMESPPDGSNSLFVCERGGLVFMIPDVAATTPQKILFLDLSSQVHDDGNELGMKGIAFDPGYATNRIFYVTYCHLDGGTRYVRLSRFLTQDGNPHAADIGSEVMLINQQNDNNVHNIADPVFGPDGYLYMGIGDEGGQSDGNNNSQRIDKDIWSAVLRIDPHKQPGSLEPNPHSGIPTNGLGEAFFSIPVDNPFVGATQFNGIAVNPAEVRTEFQSVGYRNPWQFSFDPLTDEMWLGDVGNADFEEVDVVTNGGNYGWVFFEGTHTGPRGDRTPPLGYTYTPPVWDYPHGNGTFEGNSITAGLVYRGGLYPELNGKFVCADFVSGHLWSIERTPGATNVVRFAGEGGIVQFGLDPATGEILMVDYGDGRIRRLQTDTSEVAFPQTLSQTGFFADLADLAPNPGVMPYEPNLRFWSDYATKRRWFVITNLTGQVVYARDAAWTFPVGMMWVKHFDLEMTRGDTGTVKRIETRAVVRNESGVYGVSYRWNEDETEAYLVGDAGADFDLEIQDGGTIVTQAWHIPSRAECLVCHTPSAGHALSFNTRQLNREGSMAGQAGNFLDLLGQAGYVANPIDSPALLPRHVRPDETQFSLEARARSYLAVNCAYCHFPGSGSAPETWDGRHELKLEATGLILGSPSDNGGDPANFFVVPGDEAHSVIYNRLAVSNGFSRMPPLASNELDPVGVQLVMDWIQELAGRQTYAEWRLEQFGSDSSPEGEPGSDPDGDFRNNEEEFLTYTQPTNEFSYWMADIGDAGDSVTISYELFNRNVAVELSTNLVEWIPWDVPGNQGLPLAPGEMQSISAPVGVGEGFFRFRIDEN